MRTLFYLAGRSLRGRAVRWLRQIRQPKYAVGSLVLVVWVLLVGVRPILTNVDDLAFMGFVDEFKRFIPLIRFGAAILFAIVLTVMWVVPLGKLGLPFHQAELHILLPAPVTRRNLIQLVMLRAQVPIVLTATIISLLSSDGTGGGFARSWISIWLIFSIFEWSSRFRAMHFLRLRSLRGSAVRVGYGITMAVAATYGIVLVLRLRRVVVEVQQTLLTVMDGGNARLKDILDVLESARQDAVLTILLKPFLWVAGPLMTESWGELFVAAIVPLLILVVLHEGIVRSRAPFEEPSLRQAEVAQARRDKARGRRTTGRGARESAVYRLRPGGPAAGALTWKNLMQISRFRFVRLIPLAVLVLVFWAVVPSLIGSPPWIYNIAVVFALWGFFFMPLISAMGGRNDLRRELGHIEMLRTWPIGARSLVWAEVASPAIVGAAVALFSGLLGVASVVGAQLSERMHGIEHNIKIGPDSLGGTETSTLVWMLLGLVSLWPVAASATFLICSLQNLATLLFPAWVGVGDLKPKGMAASGQNLLTALALGLAMLIATIPGALLVALTILLFVATGIQLALWQLPIAGLLLLAPYWLEMIFVNRISARLWLELDPSEEILEGGT